MPMKKELFKLLVCPKCKSKLRHNEKTNSLDCYKCRLRFSIFEGSIPNMLIDEAEKF